MKSFVSVTALVLAVVVFYLVWRASKPAQPTPQPSDDSYLPLIPLVNVPSAFGDGNGVQSAWSVLGNDFSFDPLVFAGGS